MSVDVSQLRTLVSDLQRVPPKVAKGVPPVVKKGADNVKKTMQADFRESRSFGQVAGSITYDTFIDATGAEAEIGPDKSKYVGNGRPGPLAVIAYWGGANGGGGTVRDPAHALEDEGDQFEDALSRLLEDIL